jgi:hypothetical protein
VDAEGTLHRNGVMRLATADDEILALQDHRVQSKAGYLPIVSLSRVVTRLGTLDVISTDVIEELFSADFVYLQSMYKEINGIDETPSNPASQSSRSA